MGSDSIPLWIIFAICVIGGAYFAATESAFSAVNKIKIKSLADDGKKSAKGVLLIINNFEKALTTLLIGNNVTKIAGAAVFTILATDIFREALHKDEAYLESFTFSIICSVMSTVIIFLFSEMIPKSFANDRSESVSLFFQGSLRFLMKLLMPVAAFFNLISRAATRMFSRREAEPSITEDELTEIIETAEEEGVVDEEQSDMLKSAIEFTKTTVEEIMTMAKDMNAISVNATPDEVLPLILNTVHSRLPVRAANSERILGILRVRTYLKEYRRNQRVNIRAIMTTPYIVRENAKIDNLLTHMRQHKIQMAIVQDEKKQVVGLVTIEDILEELVGEIYDEEDIVDKNFCALGGNKYIINTRMLVSDAYERMGIDAPPKRVANKPLLSIMLEKLGRLPVEDEEFLYEGMKITAQSVTNGKPTEVLVQLLDEEALAEFKAELAEKEAAI
ncbi:MAG: HlyC/CorC family transporter [Clostridia bacterium]|nr:HlyC/CorC family transporter [Clostridia bacterium]